MTEMGHKPTPSPHWAALTTLSSDGLWKQYCPTSRSQGHNGSVPTPKRCTLAPKRCTLAFSLVTLLCSQGPRAPCCWPAGCVLLSLVLPTPFLPPRASFTWLTRRQHVLHEALLSHTDPSEVLVYSNVIIRLRVRPPAGPQAPGEQRSVSVPPLTAVSLLQHSARLRGGTQEIRIKNNGWFAHFCVPCLSMLVASWCHYR